ncbi:hypothetical protein B0H11DRAFT_2106666, partial [Mycena galericulata]
RSEQQKKDREEKSRRARAHAQASKPASLPRPIPIPLASPPPNNADRAPSLLAGTAFPHSTRASSTIPPHYSPVSPPTAPAPPRRQLRTRTTRLLCSPQRISHPWSTIRRRNHRLLPRCRIQRKFPRLFPRRILTPLPAVVHAVREDLTPLLPRHILFTNHGLTVPNPVLTPNNLGRADEPVPVLTLPRHVPRPWDPYYFMPNEFSTAEKSLPGETFYGVVQSGLALVCAREYPWIDLARRDISEIVWGAHPPDELDEREDVLNLLPPDQLVFLMVLVQICRLEPDFTGFVEPAIADFVNAWLHHCWSIG